MSERTNGSSALLSLEGVNTYYGQMHILQDTSLNVGEGELVCLLGGNASGKSTTLKTVLGLVQPAQARLSSAARTSQVGRRATASRRAWRSSRRIAGCSGRCPCSRTCRWAHTSTDGGQSEDYERVYSLFPLLYERRAQLAGTLSGGEQQMVAMGRALMARPKLLLMDEPSMGLAPILVEQNFEIIKQVHDAVSRCSSSSRTRTCRSRSPIVATSSRPGGSFSRGRPRSCSSTRSCARRTSAADRASRQPRRPRARPRGLRARGRDVLRLEAGVRRRGLREPRHAALRLRRSRNGLDRRRPRRPQRHGRARSGRRDRAGGAGADGLAAVRASIGPETDRHAPWGRERPSS